MSKNRNRTAFGILCSFCKLKWHSLLLVLLLICGATFAQSEGTAPRLSVTVPFRMLSAHDKGPVIEVEVDGFKASLLIDTGGRSAISSSFVEKHNLKTRLLDEVTSLFALGGGKLREREAQLLTDHLQIGSTKFPGQIRVFPKVLNTSSLEEKVDGILGVDFLRQGAVVFDYEAQTVSWFSGGNLTGTELAAFGFDKTKHTIPLKRLNSFPWYSVSVSIGGPEVVSHIVPMIVDTGAQIALLSDAISLPGQILLEKPVEASLAFQKVYIVGGYQGSFTVGEFTVPKTKVLFTSSKVFDSLFDPSLANGFLSIDFLSHFVFAIDYKTDTLYLRPIQSTKPPKEKEE